MSIIAWKVCVLAVILVPLSRIRTEYKEILRISPCSVQMQKNEDQNNPECGHSLRSAWDKNLFRVNNCTFIVRNKNTRSIGWVKSSSTNASQKCQGSRFGVVVQKQPRRCPIKKGVLKNLSKFTGKHLACNFIKKATPTQVFSCEFWEVFKNTFFTKHLRETAGCFWL